MEYCFWHSVMQLAKNLARTTLVLLVSNQNFVLASDASHTLSTQPVTHTRSEAEFESAKLPVCTLDLTLTGTITGTSKQALISVHGRKDESFAINQAITDGVSLVDVHSRSAVIRRNGSLEKLELRNGAGQQKKVTANNNSDPAPALYTLPNVIEAKIRLAPEDSSRNQHINTPENKPVFMGMPFEPADLFTQAKIIPVSDGLQITKTVPGGLYEHLGLQDGDKILAINGESVDSLFDVISLAQQKDGTNRTQTTIVRHGNLYSVELDPARGIESRMIIDPAQIEK
jgi:type II secretory pathway component PulC